jgi:exopolysaccharide biosynthesis predicted pyruvyltransferase EpsI
MAELQMETAVNERRPPMFSELESFLETLRGVKFVYLPDPGNAGDSFIAHATYQLFDRIGLDYEIGSEFCKYPGRVVMWGGGGNLVPMYGNLKHFLLANWDVSERVIILPHTIQGNESTLSLLGVNCDIFCRDRMSYDFVRRHAPKTRVWLSHDLALSADLELTEKEASKLPIMLPRDVASARRIAKRAILPLRYKARALGRSKVLNCFRGDREKTALEIPSPNIDVSAVYATGIMTKQDSLATTYRMMLFIDGFETVNTNRLHVAILSAMLGKQVNFHPNSYGKNRAVFENSMAGRFANVAWQG